MTTELIELNAEGETKHIWDSDNPDEVEAAKALFDSLTGKGYLAFAVKDKKGNKGEQIREFDAALERMILIPPLVGG